MSQNTNVSASTSLFQAQLRTPDEIIRSFLAEGHDPIMIERHLNEMMIHFMRPIGDHQVSPACADSFYSTYLALRELVKNVGTYQKQCQAYEASHDMPPDVRHRYGLQ